MSAFIVDKHHIDLIVSAAYRWRMDTNGQTFEDIGRMLWTENLRSVEHRYPDEPFDLPGPNDFMRTDADNYNYSPTRHTLTPVEAIKAAQCLEYQSCEDPDWDASNARNFLKRFTNQAIRRLRGYEEAPWSWNREEDALCEGKHPCGPDDN